MHDIFVETRMIIDAENSTDDADDRTNRPPTTAPPGPASLLPTAAPASAGVLFEMLALPTWRRGSWMSRRLFMQTGLDDLQVGKRLATDPKFSPVQSEGRWYFLLWDWNVDFRVSNFHNCNWGVGVKWASLAGGPSASGDR